MSSDPVVSDPAADVGKDRFTSARNQLTLVLSFFARIDTKLSVALGSTSFARNQSTVAG